MNACRRGREIDGHSRPNSKERSLRRLNWLAMPTFRGTQISEIYTLSPQARLIQRLCWSSASPKVEFRPLSRHAADFGGAWRRVCGETKNLRRFGYNVD